MDYEIAGLPLHPLIVHAAVIIIPVAALLTIAGAVSGRARQKLGVWIPGVAFLALILVLLAQQAGQWLFDRIDHTPLIETHTNFGKLILPWVAGMFLLSFVEWLLHRLRVKHEMEDQEVKQGTAKTTTGSSGIKPRRLDTILSIVASVLALIFAVGSLAAVYQAGESGSRAVWEGRVTG